MAFKLEVKGFWGRSKDVEEWDIYYFTKKLVEADIPYMIVNAETKGRMSERHMVYTLEFLTQMDYECALELRDGCGDSDEL